MTNLVLNLLMALNELTDGIDVNEYYRRFSPMVYRRCLHFVKREEEALDLMQDVFVQLLRYKDKLKHQGPSSLLYTIATRLCLNRLRKKSVQTLPDDVVSQDPSERLTISRLLLEEIFRREKPSTQAIAVYHYLDGMTLEETAQMSGLSVSGVRKRLRNLQAHARIFKEETHGN